MVLGVWKRSVWVWYVFWSREKVKDWLLGSTEVKESRKTLTFLAPVIGWMVVPFTEKRRTGEKQGRGRIRSYGLDICVCCLMWTLEEPRADSVLSARSLILGHDLFQQPPLALVGSAQPWPEPPAPPPAQAPVLRQGCFYLLVLVPITCALLQLFTWSKFTLHGRRLHMVKAQRQNLSQAQTLGIKTV